MNWKSWIVGAAALLVFDALLVFGVRAYRASNVLAAPSGPKADNLSAPVVLVSGVPPVPKPMPSACVAGSTWFYNTVTGRWFKPAPVRPCTLGTVRSENDREGLIVRHPKGWRPGGE